MSYPVKHPKNGTRHHDIINGDPWPGDTFTTWGGLTYVFQSDGSGWKCVGNLSSKKAA